MCRGGSLLEGMHYRMADALRSADCTRPLKLNTGAVSTGGYPYYTSSATVPPFRWTDAERAFSMSFFLLKSAPFICLRLKLLRRCWNNSISWPTYLALLALFRFHTLTLFLYISWCLESREDLLWPKIDEVITFWNDEHQNEVLLGAHPAKRRHRSRWRVA